MDKIVPFPVNAARVGVQTAGAQTGIAQSMPDQSQGRADATNRTKPPGEDVPAFDRASELIAEMVGKSPENVRLEISADDETGRYIYKAVDKASGEIVRQFPTEELLRVLKAFRQEIGILINENA
ncbi:MAG: flagellar protein FlaG [Pseudomonadota bacterium]